ncbi:MAG: DNA mismatch repair endonuclease MutL [Verrucomicrobia bacterium]|nr:DNA mismatch repair endonuclease MutL [Verrucomicrobiota bacterium]
MNRIRLLPDQVANQIAAGEVVERPASVVKELVENALDAQAGQIHVEIQAGGRSLIRVTDDGLGMSRDDALLSLERHATSKIRAATDLASIRTLGFRGEALPSIASVSRMSLTTRERDAEAPEGTQITIHGGKILEVRAAGCAPGTSVEVRQLFFNLPARRKFLRSEETERSHIQHYVTLAAAAYPEVGFTFTQEGRMIWQLPAVKSERQAGGGLGALRERLRALSGGETKWVAVDHSAQLEPPANAPDEFTDEAAGRFWVWGFIGEPGVSRATREEQFVFVNRRPVENRGLNFALLEGYHTTLMKGRYPVCCLFLEIDPGAVDVNIHPAKREVKFHQEHAVRREVTQAVREALLNFHARPRPQVPSSGPQTTPVKPVPAVPDLPAHPPSRVESKPATREFEAIAPPPQTRQALPAEPRPQTARTNPTNQTPSISAAASEKATATTAPAEILPPRAVPEAVPLLNVPLRMVGVIRKLYVVLESDRGLVLLDQHAAHERVLFEQMLHRLEQGQAPSQRLLLPETVELSPRDAQFLREQLATLNRLGVGLSEFGERTFLLDALPPFVKASDARRFVLDLADELKATGQTVNTLRLGEHTIAKTVCRHAVKANDTLSGRELENLVNDLKQCQMPYTCPHGRPTLIEMSYRELERKFGRVQ